MSEILINEEELTESAEYALECLSKFMKRNQNLTLVDLSYTGMTEQMLFQFGAILRRAKSLRSIHLSGNKITPKLISYLVERAHAVHENEENHIPFKDLPSNKWFKETQSEININESQNQTPLMRSSLR